MNMFSISDIVFFLFDVFQLIVYLLHLENEASVLFICICIGLLYIFHCDMCAESYFYSCALKYFNNSSYFFAAVCKGDPFFCEWY
jgi:hypothetical protein